jgi:thiol:disulfide interchange protein DsbD
MLTSWHVAHANNDQQPSSLTITQERKIIRVIMSIDDGWYAYDKNPGDVGYPLNFTGEDARQTFAMPEQWHWVTNQPTDFSAQGVKNFGHENLVEIEVPLIKNITTVTPVNFEAQWMVCHHQRGICLPQSQDINIELSPCCSEAMGQHTSLADFSFLTNPVFWGALFSLFLGGLILNVMPCIFPILSMKVFSLITIGDENTKHNRHKAWVYTLGAMAAFTLLSLVLIIAQITGDASLGWGFQLQSPWFVTAIILMLFTMSLSFIGLLNIPMIAGGGRVAKWLARPTMSGEFASGFFAVFIGTPCTAPFLASALAFALTQQPVAIIIMLNTMALGFVLPYLLVVYIPVLNKIMPKPGRWMETIRQFFAFPLLLTVLWLAYVLENITDGYALIILLVILWFITLVLWVINRLQSRYSKLFMVAIGIVISLYGLVYLGLQFADVENTHHDEQQQNITATEIIQKIDDLALQQQRLIVNVTASWCMTCKINDIVTFQDSSVQNYLADNNISYIRLDWSKRNEEIRQYLARFDRVGIPLYVYYSENSQPRVLPQIVLPDDIKSLIE